MSVRLLALLCLVSFMGAGCAGSQHPVQQGSYSFSQSHSANPVVPNKPTPPASPTASTTGTAAPSSSSSGPGEGIVHILELSGSLEGSGPQGFEEACPATTPDTALDRAGQVLWVASYPQDAVILYDHASITDPSGQPIGHCPHAVFTGWTGDYTYPWFPELASARGTTVPLEFRWEDGALLVDGTLLRPGDSNLVPLHLTSSDGAYTYDGSLRISYLGPWQASQVQPGPVAPGTPDAGVWAAPSA